jgi:hypothetical protein
MILNLNDRSTFPTRVAARSVQVWTKPTWAAPFTLRTDLFATQSVWTTAPEVATAALEYRYGLVLLPGADTPVTLTKITARGYWVLIRWTSDDGQPIDWLGYAETPVTRDHTPARDGLPAAGRQTIRCTGLLRALQQCYIDNTVYLDPADDTNAIRSGGTGWTFNASSRGNRSASKVQIGGEGPSAYVFGKPRDTAIHFWTTRDIVEHLLAFHLPTPGGSPVDGGVPWSLTNLAALPNWDRPVIESDLRDVASIIGDLLQPSRLLAYTIGAAVTGSAPPVVSSVIIAPFTTIAEPLVITSGTMPANPTQIHVQAAVDPLTTITADADASAVVDQVIVQGPREIAVGTFAAHGDSVAWEKAWTEDNETAYADGGKFAADWDDLSQSDKRKRNEAIRTRGDSLGGLRDVFALWKLKPDWDWQHDEHPIFFRNRTTDPAYRPSPLAVEFLGDELPLYANIDYSGPAADVDESGGIDPLPALWFWDIPGQPTSIYPMFKGQETSKHEQELPFRGFALKPDFEEGPACRIKVIGAPQHAIAGEDFVGNDADVDQFTVFGDYPPDAWRVVMAARGDRRPRYAIPSAAEVAGLDFVRRRVETFDDVSLQSVHIAKDTVLGFDADGELVKSDGGMVRDPMPVLRSLCQLLYRQHGQPRYTASITTGRWLSSFSVGAMLASVDTEPHPINAPITSVRIDCPMTDDGKTSGRQTQTISAQTYQGDVLAILRGQQQGMVFKKRKAQRRRWQP